MLNISIRVQNEKCYSHVEGVKSVKFQFELNLIYFPLVQYSCVFYFTVKTLLKDNNDVQHLRCHVLPQDGQVLRPIGLSTMW